MRIIELVARLASGSCHTSIRLSMCEEKHYDNTMFTEVTDRTLWSIKVSRSAVFSRIHLCENKRNRSLVRILSIFSRIFLWATRRRAIDRSWHLHSHSCVTLPTKNLDTYQNWQCLIKNRVSRLVWLKTNLKCRVVPKIAELKHTLTHKCTTFSTSRLFHHFLMSARSGSTRYHNALTNKISWDLTS